METDRTTEREEEKREGGGKREGRREERREEGKREGRREERRKEGKREEGGEGRGRRRRERYGCTRPCTQRTRFGDTIMMEGRKGGRYIERREKRKEGLFSPLSSLIIFSSPFLNVSPDKRH